MQQKARKEDKRAAHKKHVARVLAKKYLVGLRENALKALKDQGMLVKPIEIVMHENVMPWLLDVMLDFLIDDNEIARNADEVVRDAVEVSRQRHL